MKAAELCAGYGGLADAIEEVFGAELAWVSEFEAAPSKILAHHWPDAPNYGDMTKIDWAAVEPVEILGGGTPCQDLSGAGRRKGMTEGTRSNLWVNMREAIATIKPTYVVWENVRGAYSAEASSDLEHCPGCMGASSDRGTVLRALGRVLGDLSDLGYDCQWRGLRAADVGAPHGRFRVFVLATRKELADSHDQGSQGSHDSARTSQARFGGHPFAGSGSNASNPTGELGHQWGNAAPREAQSWGASTIDRGRGGASSLADDNGNRRQGITQSNGISEARGGIQLGGDADGCGDVIAFPEGERRGEGRAQYARVEGGPDAQFSSDTNWGEYEPAIRRWEQTLGRRAPAPTEPTGRNGGHRLSARFAEWMMGVPNGWIVDVPGITRNEALKAAGNGVVPQQAIAALRDMLPAFESKETAA